MTGPYGGRGASGRGARLITRHPLCPATGTLRHIPADEALIGRLRSSFQTLRPVSERLVEGGLRAVAEQFGDAAGAVSEHAAALRRLLVQVLEEVIANLHRPEVAQAALRAFGREAARRGMRRGHCRELVAGLIAGVRGLEGVGWDAETAEDWVDALHLMGASMLMGAAARE